ncbi:TonB-dependent receptor [Abyssalbus ytuae]|uniref:TonB-dependent receptor n=1 Tax=Abyssalbus ytuae TaxID=2926907 RepID=A0A9E7CT14_9FLAO|nr:TonB-dependent receptor [Abyssalbus ytuae]UOB17216.1 TonB-dependent receptor [Abyssalbus ytuae]
MKTLLYYLFIISFFTTNAQIISGIVTDTKGNPVEGANVYLEGTYDGTTTNGEGEFNFVTEETGVQTLIISYLSFETFSLVDNISKMSNLTIELKEAINELSGVVISAGTFSAGDNSKVSALKPLDVVTTASALGDFVGALQTLPGTGTVAEDGRLFVRGGDAGETQIFIDGIRVFTPYTPTPNNIPARGRYSPFLFKGITFSTGGYSAEYGQALSSVLLLNSIDQPDQEKTDIGIMSVGGSLGNTQMWGENSLSISAAYLNLEPYFKIFNSRNTWNKAPQGGAGEAVYRYKLNNGIIKLYSAFDVSLFDIEQNNINFNDPVRFKLNNNNLYFNGSYKGFLKKGWSLYTGGSYTYAKNDISIIEDKVENYENSMHLKIKLKKTFSNRFNLNFGAEYFFTDFEEDFKDEESLTTNSKYENGIVANYAEADIFLSNNFAAKLGVRGEFSTLLDEATISPRVSIAYKTSENGQVSFAYGDFYQNPLGDYLKYYKDFKSEKTSHYILNYQLNREGKTFRAEVYYKDYKNLVKYNTEIARYDSSYNNNGFGYATGLDIFWRDNNSIKNLDYWISYSYLDTKRDYRNFPEKSVPGFISKHNFSLVGKYWVNDWKSQLGMSYTYSSGRPFTNPNEEGFLNSKTKSYNSISFNWAYLISPQKILYFSINNVLGTKNVFGYDYANTPNTNGIYNRQPIRPNADQFFFVGFFWTISEDKKSNQLDNL